MNEIVEFLSDNRTVFLATSDSGEARVRPFQFQFEQDGRLWFCTGRSKEVFDQLTRDPRCEFSAISKKMVSIRLKGAANLDDNMEVKRRIMAENALVRSLYGSADHPDFTVFSVDHGSAFLFDFSGDPPKSVEF